MTYTPEPGSHLGHRVAQTEPKPADEPVIDRKVGADALPPLPEPTVDEKYVHPIRRCEVHVFERIDPPGADPLFIAKFTPMNKWPIFFYGESKQEVLDKAQAWRGGVNQND